jgi:hypothetical protein
MGPRSASLTGSDRKVTPRCFSRWQHRFSATSIRTRSRGAVNSTMGSWLFARLVTTTMTAPHTPLPSALGREERSRCCPFLCPLLSPVDLDYNQHRPTDVSKMTAGRGDVSLEKGTITDFGIASSQTYVTTSLFARGGPWYGSSDPKYDPMAPKLHDLQAVS